MYDFLSTAVCSFFGGPQNVKVRQKVSKKLLGVSLLPFPKLCNPLPQKHVTIFWYEKITVRSKNGTYQPYDPLFPGRICVTIWSAYYYTLQHGTTHNTTLHFGHNANCPTLPLSHRTHTKHLHCLPLATAQRFSPPARVSCHSMGVVSLRLLLVTAMGRKSIF
jgi:hypothetical protein